ncbi:MAG TPA: TonB C-terminal domain-containing protein [Holophagaceae bacterium]|nr:TonB C-terminal domain-containing protein [Holophagaceae bacterium]
MSQDLQAFLRERSHQGETSLGLGLAVAVGLHLLPFAVLLWPHGGTAEPEPVKVTWVNLPAAAAGPSGGAAGTELGEEKGQRLRKADEVAPARKDATPGALTQPDPFASRVTKGAIKGNNPDEASKGTNTKAAKSPTPAPVAQGGAAGSGNGGGIGMGTPVPGLRASTSAQGGVGLIGGTEGGTFPYTWYLNQVQAQITANWNRMGGQQGRVQVYFRIRRDGTLAGEPKLVSESGHASLDESARMAVKRAQLPRLPDGYEAEWLGVYMWFTYLGN